MSGALGTTVSVILSRLLLLDDLAKPKPLIQKRFKEN